MNHFDKLVLEVASERLAKLPGAFPTFENEYTSKRTLKLKLSMYLIQTDITGKIAMLAFKEGQPDALIARVLEVVDIWAKRYSRKVVPIELEHVTRKSATKKIGSVATIPSNGRKKGPGRNSDPNALKNRIDELKSDAINVAKTIRKKEVRTVMAVARKLSLQEKWNYKPLTIKPHLRASWWE